MDLDSPEAYSITFTPLATGGKLGWLMAPDFLGVMKCYELTSQTPNSSEFIEIAIYQPLLAMGLGVVSWLILRQRQDYGHCLLVRDAYGRRRLDVLPVRTDLRVRDLPTSSCTGSSLFGPESLNVKSKKNQNSSSS